MNGPEIFSLVTKKKQRIEELLDPTTFVLNKEVKALQEDIAELQKECPHEYDKGVCKYCGKEEEKIMNIVLYKSTTCPQCKVVKMKLDKKGLPYTEMLVDNMTPAELAAADIKGIPTMFVDGNKMTNQREMCKWIDAQEVNNG